MKPAAYRSLRRAQSSLAPLPAPARTVLANKPLRGHTPAMSGMFFEYPRVRFFRRFWLLELITRTFASLLSRRFSNAARRSVQSGSRPEAAEFPAARQSASERLAWTFRGPRAVGRASSDALRPKHNSVNNNKDHYGISRIRERLAATPRRLPQKGRRRSPLPPEHTGQSAGQTNVLAKNHGIFLAQRESAHQHTRSTRRAPATEWFCQTGGTTTTAAARFA